MDRTALSDSFQSKREKLNALAHQLRDQRDRANDETRRHAQHRDGLNAQVRAIVDQANAHRAARDATNQKVRDSKVKRDELNKIANEKMEVFQSLRRERGQSGPEGSSPAKLQAEIRHLEYQQQTTVLTPKKEKALIDLIAAKLKELKGRENVVHDSADIQEAYEAMKSAKGAAEEAHAAVTAFAVEAQGQHDAMIKLFAQADGIRKEADAAQAAFVRHKVEADKIHREYIDAVTSIRDLDKVTYALRGQAPPSAESRTDSRGGGAPTQAQRAEAEDIFERFRKGEKLSTEDLIALQKGGRL